MGCMGLKDWRVLCSSGGAECGALRLRSQPSLSRRASSSPQLASVFQPCQTSDAQLKVLSLA